MQTSRKRILFVEQNQDGTVGGSHHALLLLVRNLDRSRFDVTVAFYEAHALLDQFRECAKVVLLPAPPPVRIARAVGVRRTDPIGMAALATQKAINLTRSTWTSCSRLIQVAVDLRPDVIHMNNSVLTGVEWLIAARLCGAACVVHQRGYARPAGYAGRFNRIICVSRDVQNRLLRDAPALAERTVQIYDAIDIAGYRRRAAASDGEALRREMGATSKDLLIGLVGNIKAWKGQEVLMRALPLLPATVPWRCLFIGATSGDAHSVAYRQHLEKLAAELGVSDRVVFAGYRSDVPALVNALDVLVHTSIEPEPLGLVVLEGMALGKAVIGTAHGGPAETIDHQHTGFLVPPGDAAALASCLGRVLTSQELREQVGRAGFESVTRGFDAPLHVARVQDMYSSFWSASPDVRPRTVRPELPQQ